MTENSPRSAENLIVLASDDDTDSKDNPEQDDDEVLFVSETPAIIDSSDEDEIIFLSKVEPPQPLDLSSDCIKAADMEDADVKPLIHVVAPTTSLDHTDNEEHDQDSKDSILALGLTSSEDKALLKDLNAVDLHNPVSCDSTTSLPAKSPSATSPLIQNVINLQTWQPATKSTDCDSSSPASNLSSQAGNPDTCQVTCPPSRSSCDSDQSDISLPLDLNSGNPHPSKSSPVSSFSSMLESCIQDPLLDGFNSFLPSVNTPKSGQTTCTSSSPTWAGHASTIAKSPTHDPCAPKSGTGSDISVPAVDSKTTLSLDNLLDDLASKLPVNQAVAVYGDSLFPLPLTTSSPTSTSRTSVITSVCDFKPITTSVAASTSTSSVGLTPFQSFDQVTSFNSLVSSAANNPHIPCPASSSSSAIKVLPLVVPAVSSSSQVAPSWVQCSSQPSVIPSTSEASIKPMPAIKPSVPVSLLLPADDTLSMLKNKTASRPENHHSSSSFGQNAGGTVSVSAQKRYNSAAKTVNQVPFKKRCWSVCDENKTQGRGPGSSRAWDSNWCSRCKLLVAYENLSRCTQGHACCATCLQQLAKAILSKGKKASLQCTYPECDSYFSISELERTLPKMVVDILEEKLDQEYVDVASDLTWRHLVDGEESMELADDEVDAPRPVEHAPKLLCQTPPNWEPMEETAGFKLVDLEGGSEEYEKCALQFYQTMVFPRADIQRIQRVQNPILWQFYSVKRTQMECENDGHPSTELLLFHGTSRHVVDAICKNGFDWRVCGAHGTMYGQGSYFARDALYSHTYTDKPPNLLYSTLTSRSQHYAVLAAQGLYHTPSTSSTSVAAQHLRRRIKQTLQQTQLFCQLQQSQQQLQHSQQHHQLHLMQQANPASNFLQLPSTSANAVTPVSAPAVIPPPPPVPPPVSTPSTTPAVAPPTAAPAAPAPVPPPAHQNLTLSQQTTHPTSRPGAFHCWKRPVKCGNSLRAHSSLSMLGQIPLPLPGSSSNNPGSAFLRVPVQQPPEQQQGVPQKKHTHVMFFARVLVGQYALGKSSLRKPPPLDPSNPYGRSYDSCADSISDPKIYVVFDSAQCYPEYIIEYTNDITCNPV